MSPTRPAADARRSPPAAGNVKEFRFPGFELHPLDNGLTLYLARYPRGPLIHQLLILPGGAECDVPERAGATALAASLMDEGTDGASALEIAYRVETLGGYLTSYADWDTMSAALGVLARHTRPGLQLLAEIASGASFPDAEIERLRRQHLAELQRRRAQPSSLASDALGRTLYAGTAYASPVLGTPATVSAIDRAQILEAADRDITPAGAALILVGDLEPARILDQVEQTFGDWRGSPRRRATRLQPPSRKGHDLVIVDRPQAPQTELWLGAVGVPRSHPDRPGLMVLNSLLGGKFTSRLNLNLRERLGITYGVSSSFSSRRGPGPFVVAASVDTAAVGTATQEILDEIHRLQDAPVSAAELADTQSYIRGIFPYSLQRIEGLADRLADLAAYDLAADYFSTYLRQIAQVTREDLQRLAQEHLDPDSMAIVAVGPQSTIEPQLSHLGSASIESPAGPEA